MEKESKSKTMFATLLTVILVLVLLGTSKSIYDYYKGPSYIVNRYISCLRKQSYDKLYNLLDQESLLWSKDEVVSYYEKVYKSQLMNVQKVGSVKYKASNQAFCELYYLLASNHEEKALELVKTGEKWQVIFPFKASEVKVHVPEGSIVYFNDEKLNAKKNNCYIKEKVLPGTYYVQVVLPRSDYEDYYEVVKVPEKTEINLPYSLVNATIHTIPGLQVQLDDLSKIETGKGAKFNDLLPGVYHLTISQPQGIIEPITKDLTINGTSYEFNELEVKLSQKGEKLFKEFLTAFYNAYIEDIKAHDTKEVGQYLGGFDKEQMLEDYKDWFIADKDIQNAKIDVLPSELKIDSKGYLHTIITETVILTNQEEALQDYKLILKWEESLSLRSGQFQVTERNLVESMVAYKDQNEKWVQY